LRFEANLRKAGLLNFETAELTKRSESWRHHCLYFSAVVAKLSTCHVIAVRAHGCLFEREVNRRAVDGRKILAASGWIDGRRKIWDNGDRSISL
jgi:hypothetical protein